MNRLAQAASPYLRQHAGNPVDWYPWGEEAFRRAREEDKPIFLSIGYSTCHWCHVMARESFEDREIAALLNAHFVAVKVDREERPDIDSIYMAVCQAFTGSGGWPTTVFITADQRPFFAGTYFPKTSRYGTPGLKELLEIIADRWKNDRAELLRAADEASAALRAGRTPAAGRRRRFWTRRWRSTATALTTCTAASAARRSSPRPTIWTSCCACTKRGATSKRCKWRKKRCCICIPAGCSTTSATASAAIRPTAASSCRTLKKCSTTTRSCCPRTAMPSVRRERLLPRCGRAHRGLPAARTARADGGFYSAQDADSDGEEGKYYLFTPAELNEVLGQAQGEAFAAAYGVTAAGNFRGRSIPNLLRGGALLGGHTELLPALREYRRRRCRLHTDDKILTVWNALAVSAFCALYRITRSPADLETAERTMAFLTERLSDGDALFISWCDGRRGAPGCWTTTPAPRLRCSTCTASRCGSRISRGRNGCFAVRSICFTTPGSGGFFLSGRENEKLLFRPKETYDGALPSGTRL